MSRILSRTRRSKLLDLVVFAAIVLAILAVLRLLPQPEPLEMSGRARIIDADSISVQGAEIRLKGVDAPESLQTCTRAGKNWPCGREAARALGNRLRGQIVNCRGRERDVHDRLLAVCWVRGTDINRWLVEQGWAVTFGGYAEAERSARNAKRGLWSGKFVRPSDWRKENR
jgi:endonuclease YncB( thermonuclease family)